MMVQKVIINLNDNFSNNLGVLSIIATDCSSKNKSKNNLSSSLTLINVPVVEEPDNLTPIQYWQNPPSNFANLLFLEETEYQILFESSDVNTKYDVLYSLTKMDGNHFKEFKFDLGDNNKFKVAGTLNFRSYVGKSFLDVKKDGIYSIKIPIEVRSKKIDYFNQYASMIADLSQQALGLIFDVKSPLYQEFEINSRKKETLYEDFMFLEYLFKYDNLPSIFEYLSKNLHSQLKNQTETVPISFASNVNQNTLKNIVTKPNKLFKSDSDLEIAQKLNGYLPYEIDQIKHEDVVDIPENRFFKYFLTLIRNLVDKLLRNSNEGYIHDKLLYFRDEIEYYLSAKFFNHISAMDYVPFNSQILQKKEGYREIFHYFLMLEFSFRLSWDEVNNQFKGFEKKLSELYEYWCYFKILKVLNNLSVNKISFEDIFEINKNKWSISIKKGISSSKQFLFEFEGYNFEVDLFYNLKFSDNPIYYSYSLPFKPDYTLLVTINGISSYIHFDAKYRSELEIISNQHDNEIQIRDSAEEKERQFKKGDIYKMHTYKDSILKTEGAYVLYPGNRTKQFFESDTIVPSVGAFSLTPGKENGEEEDLERFIKNVFRTLLFRQGLILKVESKN